MQINTIDGFLDYFEKVRKRTMRIIEFVPAENIEWTYQDGKFTIGDLMRHIATIERYMYAENAKFKQSLYPGCGIQLAEGYENILAFMEKCHKESMEVFGSLTPEDLLKKCTTPGGIEITLWKWLRLMIEHEIHHRGQIYLYLSMLEISTPPLYGLTAEEVQANSRSQ